MFDQELREAKQAAKAYWSMQDQGGLIQELYIMFRVDFHRRTALDFSIWTYETHLWIQCTTHGVRELSCKDKTHNFLQPYCSPLWNNNGSESTEMGRRDGKKLQRNTDDRNGKSLKCSFH